MTDVSPAEAVFFAALAKVDPAERAAYLNEACGADVELRRRVDRLLEAHPQVGSFLQEGAAVVPAPLVGEGPGLRGGATVDLPLVTERAGTVIGPYKLLQQIGEGGMGAVFMAEQTRPVQRKVALKLIKPGMESRQVVARFEAERQALAMMDHVNIARVFDGGATENGRPYFVMELVHGVPITKYCDDNHLTPRERLELFVPVCQAIQHAHQKGIIHRDVKPSNVMITHYDGKPVPKVIDFGVAKATEQKLTERTLFTQYGAMVGTLEYMSPEQAEMSALGVDTRSDIYSLGVLLYELLTGSTPLSRKRVKEAPYAEVLRMIKEEEPPRPSTRLSDSGEALASISAQRKTEPSKLTKLVRGELDWIVMKTLEKDRNRRYETASAFAADVQRYLNDEAVQACPPSAGYRLRKFARRNKRALATAAVLGVITLVAVGGVAWAVGSANRDREARQAAVDQEASLALKEAERLGKQGKWPEALSATKRAEGVSAGGGSEALRERVRDLRRDVEMVLCLEDARLQGVEGPHDGQQDFDYVAMDAAYRKAFRDYGIDVAALPADRAAELIRARPIRLELTGALDAWVALVTPDDKLLTIARAADPDPWRNRLRDALLPGKGQSRALLAELAASARGRDLPPSTVLSLGKALFRVGLKEESLALLRDAQQRHPDDFWINYELAGSFVARQPTSWDEAIRFYSVAWALRPGSTNTLWSLGNALSKGGRSDQAIAYFQKAIEIDPNDSMFHAALADSLVKVGQLDEAIAEYRTAFTLAPRSPQIQRKLGFALWRNGRPDESVACFQKALELCVTYFGVTPAGGNAVLGMELAQVGRWNEAAAAFDRALSLDPTDHDRWCWTAALHAIDGDLEGYRRTCREMLERFGDTDQPGIAERTAKACLLLPDALSSADSDRVQRLAERAVTGTEKNRFYRYFVLAKGLAENRAGRHEDAVKWLERFPPNADGVHWDATKFAVLAMAQHGLGHVQEAQAALAKAKAILARKMPDPAKGQLFEAGNWHDWLHAQILCREAEERLRKESGVKNQESGKKPN